MTLVAKPRIIIPKSKFRVEIDQIGDLRSTTAASLKRTFKIIETEEGGAPTLAELTVTGYVFDPIVVERPLTEDDGIAAWVDSFVQGNQDIRNGSLYALDAGGKDFYRWDLQEIVVKEYEEFAADAKGGKEESMMERITLQYRERGKRVKLQ